MDRNMILSLVERPYIKMTKFTCAINHSSMESPHFWTQIIEVVIISVANTVLVGSPLAVRDVSIVQEPLWEVDLPGGLYSLIRFQGTVSGRVSGSAFVNLNALQITIPFHNELWSLYTFNGG